MILVKTQLKLSKVHGIGLFADQFIPKGTKTWEYHSEFDKCFTEGDIKRMSEPARKLLLHYAYYDQNLKGYILPFDDQRFINHSSNLEKINIISQPEVDIAARDILPGEELLCDYNKFDDTYFRRLNIDENKLIF